MIGLKLDISKYSKEGQLYSIFFVLFTKDESKWEKSIKKIFLEFISNSPLKKFSRLLIGSEKWISIELFASITKGSFSSSSSSSSSLISDSPSFSFSSSFDFTFCKVPVIESR